MSSPDRGPGVPFPPPIIFVAGFGLAWFLDTRLEFVIDGDGTIVRTLYGVKPDGHAEKVLASLPS